MDAYVYAWVSAQERLKETEMNAYTRLEDGSLVPTIPEPFWERSWRTLFLRKPKCCNKIFWSRAAYELHYIYIHAFRTRR